MLRLPHVVCVALAGSALAHAQSASLVTSSAGGANVLLGQTVTISVAPTTDTGNAVPGVFGSPGFYGFGGNINASGTASVSASSPAINPLLDFGATASLNTGAALVRAGAGRGLQGGLVADPASILTFDLTIDADAADGDEITLEFEGAVVLALGDALTTFATSPGTGQFSLVVTPLVLTVSGACSPADLTTDGTANGVPDGAVTLSDFSFYLSLWGMSDSVADLTTDGTSKGVPDGTVTLSDFSFYLGLWGAGCP